MPNTATRAWNAGSLIVLSPTPSATAAGADLIDGAATKALSTQYAATTIRSDGSANWFTVGGGGGGGSSTLAGDTDVSISSPADGDRLTYQASSSKWINSPEYVYVTVPLGDGANTITTGTKQPDAIAVPVGTLAEARLVTSGSSGNVTADILRATYSAFPTFTSLVGSGTKPNLANAATSQKYSDTSFTSWTSTTFAEGDMIQTNVTSVATLTSAQLILKVRRTD